MEYDLTDKDQEHLVYKQFVAYHCNRCSITLLMIYANNKMFQELPTNPYYFYNSNIYFDLRDSKGYRYG